MTLALKMLRMVQWGMLASILLFVFVGEVASRSTHGIDPSSHLLIHDAGRCGRGSDLRGAAYAGLAGRRKPGDAS